MNDRNQNKSAPERFPGNPARRKYTLTPSAVEQRRMAGIASGESRPFREYKSIRLGSDTVAAIDAVRGDISRDKWAMAAAMAAARK